MPKPQLKPRRRLSAPARRHQIITAAREVFAAHPYERVSTADIAAAAGVTRALVHHYFHGIDAVRQAVAAEILQSTIGTLQPSEELSVADRVRSNIGRFLDVVDANRDAWFAALGSAGEADATPAGRALRQAVLEQIIANNAKVFRDTSWARLCVTGYIGFSDAVCRGWLDGQTGRDEAERALSETLLHLLVYTIPEGQRAIDDRLKDHGRARPRRP